MRRRLSRSTAALLTVAAVLALAPAASAGPRAQKSVIGGQVADLSQWGFTVAVETPGSLCTGAVVAPTRVLTAAHCIPRDPSQLLVRAHSVTAFNGGETRGVSSAVIAPGWGAGLGNDLAVLTLNEPTTAPVIEIATKEQTAAYTRPGSVLSIAGFGRRNPKSRGNPQAGLLTTAQVFAHGFCPLPIWAICDAGGPSGLVAKRRIRRRLRKRPIQKAVCSGDSGGPLIASTAEGPRLVGVAEAGTRPARRSRFKFVHCGLKGFPSIHTRVTEHLDFLQLNLAP